MQQNNGKSKLGLMDKCNMYWNAAEKIILKKKDDPVLQREFRQAHRIILATFSLQHHYLLYRYLSLFISELNLDMDMNIF